MNTPNENVSMALFCDFENVALGVRDTKYQKFDIRPVLERLLLKGSIVVKKAYCDWERYKEFKAPMHEANFELIEIPHVRQSGKNSADIRLVVDALDFCYTKSHVNTFVIISGDSDFSPLVSKLRENNKKVIGVGVKQSTSDLLIANCDEFIFYDDLAREGQRTADARRDTRGGANAGQRRTPDEERRRKEELEARKTQAVEMVVETFEALMAERGDSGKIWASALKDALKRRKPDFNESYYGFRAFGNLLDEAQSRGFLEVGREEKSGTYVYRDSADSDDSAPAVSRAGSNGGSRSGRGRQAAPVENDAEIDADDAQANVVQEEANPRPSRRSRGGRKSGRGASQYVEQGIAEPAVAVASDAASDEPVTVPQATQAAVATPPAAPSRTFVHAEQAEANKQADAKAEANKQAEAEKQAEADRQTAQELEKEVAKLEAMRADALARAQAPKPVQASRLPPMPTPLPQARQPIPAVNIAEWTFVEPVVETRREPTGKAPAKQADPFAGAPARPVEDAPASPAVKRAATRTRSATKTAAAKTGERETARTSKAAAVAEPAKAGSASAPQAEAASETAAKTATKAPAKTASKTAGKTATRARQPRKTAASES
ncbi:NYN domain-containing protein [Achromobacter marplatensis]|uniref:NYN domain-containing protein n=1 Tax=Achromobacter marplatensis TaxID=470868 RepID=UPI0039F6AA86